MVFLAQGATVQDAGDADVSGEGVVGGVEGFPIAEPEIERAVSGRGAGGLSGLSEGRRGGEK